MDGVGGLEGWRWIFILEVVAVFAFFLIYDFPETAKFLTKEERAWVVARLKYEGSGERRVAQAEKFEWKYVKDAFMDWQIYVGLISKWHKPDRDMGWSR